MFWKTAKDSLPWLLPSIALVVVASGLLDRGNEGGFVTEAQLADALAASDVPEVATTGQTEKASLLTSAVAVPAPEAEEKAAVVASYAPDEAEPEIENVSLNVTLREDDLAEATAPEPEPEEVAVSEPVEEIRTAALEPEYDAAAFFTTARANLEAELSCKEDLRTLANQAKIYFPSGGLTADSAGMEMARLIGVVAQNCPGVRIEVQGHSDPSGNPDTNLKLSQERAEQVLLRLGASGIDTTKFVARGFGDQRPSSVTGPQSRAYYDRRVEFAVLDAATTPTGFVASASWDVPSCVAELQAAVASTKLFYAPRSISVLPSELDVALSLANQAMACPQARLRVIGHHSADVQSGENIGTGMLRAKALMSMLVSRGVTAEEVIIAAPSRPGGVQAQPGLSNSRIDFDVIVDGS